MTSQKFSYWLTIFLTTLVFIYFFPTFAQKTSQPYEFHVPLKPPQGEMQKSFQVNLHTIESTNNPQYFVQQFVDLNFNNFLSGLGVKTKLTLSETKLKKNRKYSKSKNIAESIHSLNFKLQPINQKIEIEYNGVIDAFYYTTLHPNCYGIEIDKKIYGSYSVSISIDQYPTETDRAIFLSWLW